MRRLPVSHSPNSDYLQHAGAPVWPARTRQELALLRRTARSFGAVLQPVSATSAIVCGGRECVVGLGEETRAATALYAHLTQRTAVMIEREAELESVPDAAVVVVLYDRLSAALLNTLAVHSRRILPGIITAADRHGLRDQVLMKTAAAALCGPAARRRVGIYPLLSLRARHARDHVQLGLRASPRSVRKALATPCGVLTIDTHSDGLDAFLGSHLTLCPLRPAARGSSTRRPYCLATGHCYRQHLPIADARRQGRLVSPADVAARVLVFNACRALLLPKGNIDPRWGLATRLLEANIVGAMLMGWEMNFPLEPTSDTLSRLIAAGVPVGIAAKQAMQGPGATAFGDRMCLLGDPRTRAVPIQTEPQHRTLVHAKARPARSRITDRSSTSTAFLKRCLAVGAALGVPDRRRRLAHAARTALDRYDRDRRGGVAVEHGPDASGPRFRGALLEYLLRRGELFEDWSRFGQPRRATRRGTCAHCGERLKRYVIEFKTRAYAARVLDTCPHCEIVRDAPLRTNIAVGVDQGRIVRLSGALPRRRWAAGVLLSSWRQDRLWMWPAATDGSMAPEFVPPGGLPDRHVYALVCLVWRTSVIMLRASARGQGSVPLYLATAGWQGTDDRVVTRSPAAIPRLEER